MNDMIGTTDGMAEPGSDAWARVTGIVTAGVLVAEGRVRGQTDTLRDRDRQDRRRAAEDRLRDAAARTGARPARVEQLPDSRITAALWHQAATSPHDPAAAGRMRAAERQLRISEPALMARYDAEVRAGRDALSAMSAAMRETRPNPHPPQTAPAQVWPAGQPVAHTPTPPAAATDTTGRLRRVRSLLTGKGTHQ